MIKPMEVKRDECGYWFHPDYVAFCKGRKRPSLWDFAEEQGHGLEWLVTYPDTVANFLEWDPKANLDGDWTIVAITSGISGPCCCFVRNNEVSK